MNGKRLVLAGFSAFLLSTGLAAAATCDAVGVTGASMCETGSTNNDKLNVGPDKKQLQVNLDSIFDMDTWKFLSKDEDGSLDGKHTFSGGFDHYLVVLKGAKEFDYQAYKVDAGTLSVDYSLDAFFDGTKTKRTSHASFYGKNGGGVGEVPLPAAGFLLLAGLGGLAMMRRKAS